MLIDKVPQELQKYAQWVMWRYEKVNNKWTKIPFTTKGTFASTTNPTTWTTITEAIKMLNESNYFDGIGFVFTDGDPFIGVDWDNVIVDGILDYQVHKEVLGFESYAEYSPSGNGIHCICKGKIPKGSPCRKGNKEIYSRGRFFTFTGKHLPLTPLNICEAPEGTIESFLKSLEVKKTPVKTLTFETKETNVDKMKDIIARCRISKYKELFNKLIEGDISNFTSHSEADFTFCYILARHTNNAHEIDLIFRASKLYRSKWETSYYRNRTINMAMTHALVADIEELVEE